MAAFENAMKSIKALTYIVVVCAVLLGPAISEESMTMRINPKPSLYRGVTLDGNGFVEIELLSKGRGVIKYCSFSFKQEGVGAYRFTWSVTTKEGFVITDIERVSKFDAGLLKVTADWHSSDMQLKLTGKDWERQVHVFDAVRWEKAVTACQRQQ